MNLKLSELTFTFRMYTNAKVFNFHFPPFPIPLNTRNLKNMKIIGITVQP